MELSFLRGVFYKVLYILTALGGLHTLEPWIIKQEWKSYFNNSGVVLECIDFKENGKICDSNTCKNGGTCYEGRHDYYSNCTTGWKGKNCDEQSKFNSFLDFITVIPQGYNQAHIYTIDYTASDCIYVVTYVILTEQWLSKTQYRKI